MYKKQILITALLLAFSTLHADYLLKESKRVKSKIDRMPKGVIGDMKKIPQNPAYYAKQIKPFSKSRHKKLDKAYNKKYFKPWTLSTLDLPRQDFGWEMRFVRKKPIYRVKGSRISASTYERWIKNAN
jgi:hypothetical protein